MGLPEVTVHGGAHSQIGANGRWGDYASVVLDPLDDDSFWATHQYAIDPNLTGGTFNWDTRIFKFHVNSGSAAKIALADESNDSSQPSEVSVGDPYPNPTDGSSRIDLRLPEGGTVVARLYDILGRTVRTLTNSTRDAGLHRLSIQTNDLQAGMYILRVVVLTGDGQRISENQEVTVL